MVSKIVWHGTDATVAPGGLEPRVSFLEALWFTGDPEVAALYAGPEGVVHGFVFEDEKLLASRDVEGLVTYPSAKSWERIKEWMERSRHLDTEAFNCLDPFKIEAGFVKPLGNVGQPSWDELFNDLCECLGDGEDLIQALGCVGIVLEERIELALGDRAKILREQADGEYLDFARRLKAHGKRPRMSVGVVDPSGMRHVCTVEARDLRSGAMRLPVTRLRDIADMCTAAPSAAALYVPPVPAFA